MSDRDDWRRIHGITDEQALDAIEAMGRTLDAGTAEIAALRTRLQQAEGLLRDFVDDGCDCANRLTSEDCRLCSKTRAFLSQASPLPVEPYDGPIEPGMRFVYRWNDDTYGPPGDLIVPDKSVTTFWNDRILATLRSHWLPFIDDQPASPPPDPVAAVLAVRCPDGHNGPGSPCISQDFGHKDGYVCASRIRAAAGHQRKATEGPPGATGTRQSPSNE